MTTQFYDITYLGYNIEDQDTFDILPFYLKEFLSNNNGLIAYNGGIHFRGCVKEPVWHSLYHFWFGKYKLSDLFDNVDINDIPIAQDCFGDQYLIRKDQLIKLSSEIGEIECLEIEFNTFINQIISDPYGFLNIERIKDFNLMPGQLLSVFPPFCIKSESERSIKSINTEEQILFLSDFSKKIRNMPDSTEVQFKVIE